MTESLEQAGRVVGFSDFCVYVTSQERDRKYVCGRFLSQGIKVSDWALGKKQDVT